MPGRLMFDGKDPDLFDHFSIVAQRLGVYTVRDYADIVRHLVQIWAIARRPVSGKAARAQEFLCRHAERIESQAEQIAARLAAEPRVPFSWIHDRLA
jgi:acyl-[acyl-carrier-protein] desaturase